ncbi:MAG: hypothetical protein AAFX93_11255 [Verrucomicrobiota bacterium]
MFSKIHAYIALFSVMIVIGLSALDAKPRRLSDLGSSNSLTDEKFDVGESSSPRGDRMFGDNRVNFGEWHGTYSSIGEKRMDTLKQRGGKQFSTGEVSYDRFERERATISLDTDDRKLATIQNWNTVRDNVMSDKFSNTEMQTPEARKFSEMVDEVSLRDINRFQFMKNKTDEGIPVQQAGTDSGPQLNDKHKRVMARIDGQDSAVSTYEEQGAESVQDGQSGDDKGFFESLFDW